MVYFLPNCHSVFLQALFYVNEDFLVGGAEERLAAEVAGGEEAIVLVQYPFGGVSRAASVAKSTSYHGEV